MKRYLLFCFDDFYPCGGWNDFREAFSTPQDAEAAATVKGARHSEYSGFQVVDSKTGEIVNGGPTC